MFATLSRELERVLTTKAHNVPASVLLCAKQRAETIIHNVLSGRGPGADLEGPIPYPTSSPLELAPFAATVRESIKSHGSPLAILRKDESRNGTTSLKERVAYMILASYQSAGLVCQNSNIYEASSGNLGTAVAKFTSYLPETTASICVPEVRLRPYLCHEIRAHRGRLIPLPGTFDYACKVAARLAVADPNGVFLDQAANPVARVGQIITAVEFALQFVSLRKAGVLPIERVQVVVTVGIGTGATFEAFRSILPKFNTSKLEFEVLPVYPDVDANGFHKVSGLRGLDRRFGWPANLSELSTWVQPVNQEKVVQDANECDLPLSTAAQISVVRQHWYTYGANSNLAVIYVLLQADCRSYYDSDAHSNGNPRTGRDR